MALSRTIALVSGGSSGLGAATVNYLLRQGAKGVVVADLNPKAYETNIDKSEGRVAFAETDVTQTDQVEAALDLAETSFGESINAAICCAGIAVAKKTYSTKSGPHGLDDFTKTLTVNTIGTFNVARLAAARMATRDLTPDDEDGVSKGLRGCIVLTASIAGYEGQVGQVAYAASKGGVIGMCLPMARELAPYGIRVMTIAPGLFETPLLDGLPEAVKQELGATVPCPSRLGRPEEFGQLVGSILTIPTLNGSVIRLDGALRMPP